jgi:hypothetical protein
VITSFIQSNSKERRGVMLKIDVSFVLPWHEREIWWRASLAAKAKKFPYKNK